MTGVAGRQGGVGATRRLGPQPRHLGGACSGAPLNITLVERQEQGWGPGGPT